MLSVLIPTYNHNCSRLIQELKEQLQLCGVPYEIIVADDGSPMGCHWLHRFEKEEFVDVIALKENVGRSAIRNLLADRAKYPYLLFMDNDAKVCREDYIEKYLKNLQPEVVLVGGRAYNPETLPECYSLHLTYDKLRESNANYNKYFTTFNFVIPKALFNRFRFDTQLNGYGHEDFLLGLQMKQAHVEIQNIDNPLIHEQLDTNVAFIRKSEQANVNLLHLYHHYPELQIAQHSKLLSSYVKVDKLRLTKVVALGFKLSKPMLVKNLTSAKPSLLYLDLYKLGHLCLNV